MDLISGSRYFWTYKNRLDKIRNKKYLVSSLAIEAIKRNDVDVLRRCVTKENLKWDYLVYVFPIIEKSLDCLNLLVEYGFRYDREDYEVIITDEVGVTRPISCFKPIEQAIIHYDKAVFERLIELGMVIHNDRRTSEKLLELGMVAHFESSYSYKISYV